MLINLEGKTALVTGASRGIGRACALALARAGADVMVSYVRAKAQAESLCQEISALGRETRSFAADVAREADVEALFADFDAWRNGLDILVFSAGIIRDNLLGMLEAGDWDSVVDTNLRGAFLCSRAAAARMIPRHAGKIINISSIAAIRSSRGQSNYAASKGGLVSFTRACAVELAPKGIQVNAVLPGFVETDMTARVRKRAGEEILRRIPAGRYGLPADIAGPVVFLASPQADFITGQTIVVDGGASIA